MSAPKFEQPVPGNPDVKRFEIYVDHARRKGTNQPFHSTVEWYDVQTADEAIDRFNMSYETDVDATRTVKEVDL